MLCSEIGSYKSRTGSPRIGPDHQSGSDQLGSTKNYENYKTKTFKPYFRLNVFSRNYHNQVQQEKSRNVPPWLGAAFTRHFVLLVQVPLGSLLSLPIYTNWIKLGEERHYENTTAMQ